MNDKEVCQVCVYPKIIENIKELFWVCSADGNEILYLSPVFEKIWERSPQDFYNDSNLWKKFIHPEDLKRVSKEFANIFKNDRFESEFRIITPSGKIIWIRSQGFPVLDRSGRVQRIAGIAQNISHHKQVEEEKELLHQALVQQKNMAIKEVLREFQDEKGSIEAKIMANIKSFIIPILDQVKAEKKFSLPLIERLEESLNQLLSPFGKNLRQFHADLSTKEMEVCKLVKSGLSTKQIADMLNISENTVITHRNHVREKLGIKNNKVNLSSYLHNLSL